MSIKDILAIARDTHRIDDASRLVDHALAVDIKTIEIGLPVALLSDRNVGNIASVDVRIQATKGQFRTSGSQLHRKYLAINLSIEYKGLEE